LEVLDEAGRHVGPGETGRVVLTSLYNYATPLIRYEIGDYARLGAHRCACGRMLPVLSEVHGRRRNMITLPDGRRLWLPGRTLSAMAAFVPSRRMRLVQLAPDRFQLLYEVDGSAAAPDMTGLSACAARLIHPDVTIDPQAVEELSRSAGGKYEDIVGLDA
jgi:phenylacetate-CoA ligase